MFTITEVQVKLADTDTKDDRCLAFVTIILDYCFIIYDIRIVCVREDHLIVAMPDRPSRVVCKVCGARIAVSSEFCNRCGKPQPLISPGGKRFDSVCNPITQECRAMMDETILNAYAKVLLETENRSIPNRIGDK